MKNSECHWWLELLNKQYVDSNDYLSRYREIRAQAPRFSDRRRSRALCLSMESRLVLLFLFLLIVKVGALARQDVFTFEADRGEYQVFVKEPQPQSLTGLPPLIKDQFRPTLVIVVLYPATPTEEIATRSAIREIKVHRDRAALIDASIINAVVMIGRKDDKPKWTAMKVFPGNDLQVQLIVKKSTLIRNGRPLKVDSKN
jgi:hypothetical protein